MLSSASLTWVVLFTVGNLKQLILQWYKDNAAFLDAHGACLPTNAWCKRLRDTSDSAKPDAKVLHFAFKHTPKDAPH